MATLLLKKGDKGENVKILQKALGVTADGDFGPNTEAAVKAFQKSKGLTVDGLVGDTTQKALEITFSQNTNEEIEIIKKPLTKHISKTNRIPKYIVIHYTAGASSESGRAIKTRDNWENSNREASADFVVDDTTIVQANPNINNYYCSSVGDGKGKYGITNKNSISIEMCSNLQKGTSAAIPNHSGWKVTDKVIDKTFKLTQYLMNKYNIPIDNVIRHYDASRKSCPGLIGWNDNMLYDAVTGKSLNKKNNSSEWDKFKKRLK